MALGSKGDVYESRRIEGDGEEIARGGAEPDFEAGIIAIKGSRLIRGGASEASLAARMRGEGGEGLSSTKLDRGSRSKREMKGHDGGKAAQGEEDCRKGGDADIGGREGGWDEGQNNYGVGVGDWQITCGAGGDGGGRGEGGGCLEQRTGK